MKKSIIIIIVLFCSLEVMAQPGWAVTPSDYQFSMTVTGQGLIDCQENIEANDQIAAFVGGVCRGVINFNTLVNGSQLAYLIVYSDQSIGEGVNFIFYDASEDLEIAILDSLVFEENGSIGNSNIPYIFSNNNPPTAIYISAYNLTDATNSGDILAGFSVEDEDNETYNYSFINGTTNDNNLFGIINDSLIISQDVDIQVQNSFLIEVIAENGMGCSISDTFRLEVNNTNEAPTDILLANDQYFINENENIGTFIDSFLVSDLTQIDVHTYSLDSGEMDNNLFTISGVELLSNEIFNYEAQEEYQIVVTVVDGVGNSFEKEMTIEIRDVVEADDLKANNIITPNDDGFNDYLTVPNIELFADYEFQIFNENGNLVFRRSSSIGYDNLWNGKNQKGNNIPSGVYYYFLRNVKEDISFKGEVTLLRD